MTASALAVGAVSLPTVNALEKAERLKRLLNDILTYSREPHLTRGCFDLSALCQALARSLRESPAAQGRRLELSLPPEPLVVEGDRDRLKQVFINLITNAFEAIAPAQTVTWRVMLQVPHVEICVHNGGEPIPAQDLPQLTKPFVSTKPSGTGLGLAITQRIVEAHGGQLAIARHSLDAQLIHWQTGQILTTRTWVWNLYGAYQKSADQAGLSAYLRPLLAILDQGNQAQRWLADYR
ncbi:MAG: hypothetical protein KME20_20010 [Kaiparowitsia implicata GSE-PSE-MK54-09C]|nr:hypothetical protein [Kaiparowitsia implicata GSE-PSE-MK54-09C]